MLWLGTICKRTNIYRHRVLREEKQQLPRQTFVPLRSQSRILLPLPARKIYFALRRPLGRYIVGIGQNSAAQMKKPPHCFATALLLTDRPRLGQALHIYPNLWGFPCSSLVGRLPLPEKRTCCCACFRRSNRSFCCSCCWNNRLSWCSWRIC